MILVYILGLGITLGLSCTTVLTPLWIDSVQPRPENRSDNSSSRLDSYNHVDGFCMIFTINLIFVIFAGAILLFIKLFKKGQLTDADTQFPKRQFFGIGLCDSISSVCFVYASGGSRTAPYLQSLVTNFAIPITFIVRATLSQTLRNYHLQFCGDCLDHYRFLILRKTPTLKRLLCSVAVLLAELLALLPSIFPSLENAQSKKEDGGASGVAGVLWPLCYAFGYVPQAIWTVVVEKSTKTKATTDSQQVNPFYLMFWMYLFTLLCTTCLFWSDIIPGFGMTDNINQFFEIFSFNIKCYFGSSVCPNRVHWIAWGCTLALFSNRILCILFLSISEGANYLVIVQSLQIPVVILFWSLFNENPFKWNPHVHLSTWLSIGATVVMIPAIYIYNTGRDTESLRVKSDELKPLLGKDDRNHFNDSSVSYTTIQADSPLPEEYYYSED